MKPAFLPRLLNSPFGDPGLYVGLRYEGRAMLFDLGRLDRRPAADLLKLSHVFVSHTHMDHFFGFDQLLRVLLARDRHLHLFGPPGIIDNVRGKLAGYTWNLVDGYPFVLTVHEVGFEDIREVTLPATDAFRPRDERRRPFSGVLYEGENFLVRAVHLDHRIPCLGFCLEEKTRFNIRPEKLQELGLGAGPWLKSLKQAVRDGLPGETPICARWRDRGEVREVVRPLAQLARELVVSTRGQKLGYVVDVIFTRRNVERIVELIRGADLFYCESLFLDADRDQATQRYHLTARQAGTIARLAGVRRLINFHFSPRYERNPEPLRSEALRTFHGELPPDEPA